MRVRTIHHRVTRPVCTYARTHVRTDGQTEGRTVIVDLPVAVDIGCPDHVVDLLAAEPLAQTVHRRPQLVGVDLTAAVKVKHCRADTTVTSTHAVADASDVSTHQHTRSSF